MEHHFLSIEEFNALLEQWSGKNVKITKHEMNDIDETVVALDEISYARNTRRIDDYQPMHELQLNGNGITDTLSSPAELPDSQYEIPLEDTSLYEFDGERFLISTDRAVYKIELV
ncbi:hypothetical protein ACFO3D_09370 [Virgibacillus kekensis]|uniref:Uncharacterized protein n=1 Tax=Virgibacillus kekensis TaxID=202261 RepID=A0ABV9DHW8_9BACI